MADTNKDRSLGGAEPTSKTPGQKLSEAITNLGLLISARKSQLLTVTTSAQGNRRVRAYLSEEDGAGDPNWPAQPRFLGAACLVHGDELVYALEQHFPHWPEKQNPTYLWELRPVTRDLQLAAYIPAAPNSDLLVPAPADEADRDEFWHLTNDLVQAFSFHDYELRPPGTINYLFLHEDLQ